MTVSRRPCVFCEIAAGRTASEVVFEDARFLVILDHRPLIPGHCLVLTRAHVETFLDVPAPEVGPLFEVVQRTARAVETGLGADGSFVALNNRVSQSVPHVHVHVVPRKEKDGLFARSLVWKRQPYPNAEAMAAMRERIRAALA